MARAVGVEITEASVRLLSYEQGGDRGKILQFHQTAIPAEADVPWEDRAAKALKEAFAVSKAPRSRVVAAVDSGHAILREVTLPFKGEDQIRKTVRFELESLIHNHAIDELVVSYYKTGETDKGTLLLAAAVPKDVVARTLRVFEKAGVDPVALDLDVCAVFNAMKHAGAITDEPHLLVYGTSKFTKLILVEDRKPRSIRTIRFALPGEAEPAAELPGETPIVIVDPEDGPSFQELDPAVQGTLVEILAKEVARFLLAHAGTSSPSHILLAGDFEDPVPASKIEAATKIPVRTFNLLEAMDGAGDRSARVAAPLGLALKGAGSDALGMDFRQDEFQYRKKFDALKTTALVTAELLIVLLAAVTLHLWFKRSELAKANAFLLEEQRNVYRGALNEELADATQAYPKLAELYRKAAAEGGQEGPLVESGRTAWIALFDALQRFQRKYASQKLGGGELYLEIDGVEIQQTTTSGNESLTLTFRGKIRNHEYAGVLKNEVRAAEVFANADWSAPFTPLEGGLYQFSLKSTKAKAKRGV
jgi:Tfp pilus assembly PilM family ATPase